MRITWNEYFMEIARVVAKRSTCLRRQVGAVLVKDNRILATGYNGAPSKIRHCAEVGCLRIAENVPSGERHELCRGLHAEQNAIIQAALHGVGVQGSVLYSTDQPCILCTKMLINSGIVKIIYAGDYPDGRSLEMLKEAGITVVQWKGEELGGA
jgi:dCMP deaminase